MDHEPLPPEPPALKRARRIVGIAGVGVAAVFLLWVPAGLLPGVPSVIEVFGVDGLRTPASFTVGGLMLGAIGFFEP